MAANGCFVVFTNEENVNKLAEKDKGLLRIGDNGALIPTGKADEYKLVYYNEDSDSRLNIQAVYKLENYDYNMRDDKEYNHAKHII